MITTGLKNEKKIDKVAQTPVRDSIPDSKCLVSLSGFRVPRRSPAMPSSGPETGKKAGPRERARLHLSNLVKKLNYLLTTEYLA